MSTVNYERRTSLSIDENLEAAGVIIEDQVHAIFGADDDANASKEIKDQGGDQDNNDSSNKKVDDLKK